MKINIAHDARPQVRTLLIATLLTVALWFIPYADVLTYPFRIFVTFIHEGGHALAAVLTGNSVFNLSVAMNGEGETYTTTGGLVSQLLVSSAGYLGAMTFGAALLVLIRRATAARVILAASAALVVFLTVVYGIVSPLMHLQFFSLFTVVAGALISIGLLAAARYANARTATFLASFLAVQCVLNALFDLKALLFLSSPFARGVQTDAVNMANATGLPPFVWAFLWTAIAFVILSIALRVYAVSRTRPRQQDLPFEDSFKA
ncbi:MAG: hypothetical protein NVSMB56_11950 [Pyrinomonadaceae bacterium]